MSISVNNSNSTSHFLKKLDMLTVALVKNELEKAHIFQCTSYKKSQTHLKVKMYHFEHINYDTHLDFYSKMAIVFHQIFSSYPQILRDKFLFLITK